MSPVFWRYDPNLPDEERDSNDLAWVIVAAVLLLAALIGAALILGSVA